MKLIFSISLLFVNLALEAQIPIKKLSLDNFIDKKIVSITNSSHKTESYIESSKMLLQNDILEKHVSFSKPKNDKYPIVQEINRFQYTQGSRSYDSNNQFDREPGTAFVEGVWDFIIRKPVRINYNVNGLPTDTLGEIPSVAYYEALWGYHVMSLNKNFPGIFLFSYPEGIWKEGLTWSDSVSQNYGTYNANKYQIIKIDNDEVLISFNSIESPINIDKLKEPKQSRVVLHGSKILNGELKINIVNNMITFIKAKGELTDYRHDYGNVKISKQYTDVQILNKLIPK
jgi:hypothetical protein